MFYVFYHACFLFLFFSCEWEWNKDGCHLLSLDLTILHQLSRKNKKNKKMATTPSGEEVLLQSVKIRKSRGIPLPSKVKNQLPERKKPKYSNHERTGSQRQVRATVLFPFTFLAAETHSYQTLLPFVSDCQTTTFFFFFF